MKHWYVRFVVDNGATHYKQVMVVVAETIEQVRELVDRWAENNLDYDSSIVKGSKQINEMTRWEGPHIVYSGRV